MEKDLLTYTFSNLYRKLVATARGVLGPQADVDDVLQESFCRLWTHRQSIRNDVEAGGLVVTTVRNMSIDVLRRRSSHPVMAMVDDSMEDAGLAQSDEVRQRNELLAEVTEVIDRTLTERQRDILYKRERDGWEVSEIARYYELTEANVRMILSRARVAVREAYREKQRK